MTESESDFCFFYGLVGTVKMVCSGEKYVLVHLIEGARQVDVAVYTCIRIEWSIELLVIVYLVYNKVEQTV